MKAEYDESLRDGLTAAFLFVSLLLIFPIQRKIIIYLINVTDSGIGIASEKQEKIFLNFYQIQGGLRDKTPGVGLGLSITRRLVELHGGKIWVQSDGKGQGCQFSFSLPLIINNQQSTINSQQSK